VLHFTWHPKENIIAVRACVQSSRDPYLCSVVAQLLRCLCVCCVLCVVCVWHERTVQVAGTNNLFLYNAY
jgi:hypothetical protein